MSWSAKELEERLKNNPALKINPNSKKDYEEVSKSSNKKSKNKFNAQKTEVDGITFH